MGRNIINNCCSWAGILFISYCCRWQENWCGWIGLLFVLCWSDICCCCEWAWKIANNTQNTRMLIMVLVNLNQTTGNHTNHFCIMLFCINNWWLKMWTRKPAEIVNILPWLWSYKVNMYHNLYRGTTSTNSTRN